MCYWDPDVFQSYKIISRGYNLLKASQLLCVKSKNIWNINHLNIRFTVCYSMVILDILSAMELTTLFYNAILGCLILTFLLMSMDVKLCGHIVVPCSSVKLFGYW
jgi:hypothetical protein